MSRIFDALQKSEAERSGNGDTPSSATELLHLLEREASKTRNPNNPTMNTEPANAADYLTAGAGSPMTAVDGSEPAQQPADAEEFKSSIPELELEQRQRDELMKFIQQMFLIPGAPRTIVLTGIEAGTGCSWICCRAGQLLSSQIQGSVCVVDANFRSPGLHHNYGVENHHGFSDALASTEPIRSFLRPLGKPNLWLLSCGSDPANPVMDAHRLRVRISELRQHFEYVLIDSPALSVSTDAIILGGLADAVVLVLKAHSSRREAARKALQDLQKAGVRVLGAVLNQRTFPIPESLYRKL